MIELRNMTESVFNEFKNISQQEYAAHFSSVERVSLEDGLRSVAEQFARLAPNGQATRG